MIQWWRCRRGRHDWFPGVEPREFLAGLAICLGCRERLVVLPYGTCLTGHPLAEHYDAEGNVRPAGSCPRPL